MSRRVLVVPVLVLASAAAVPPPVQAAPAAVTAPAAGTGHWSVAPGPDGGWRVRWTAPAPLPVGGDRPALVGAGPSVPATVATDGRTVVADVATVAPPDPADLDVVLGGDRLDEPGYDLAPGGTGAGQRGETAAPTGTPLPTDPAAEGPYAVTTSDYELAPVKVRGLPKPVEMVGHVVEPALDADTGPRPLVLLLHGRHGWCYDPTTGASSYADTWPCAAPQRELPNHLGYDYLQQRLASQGFATVSIRANGISAQDGARLDGGSAARADLVRRHLAHWVDLAAEHRLDLDRVVLVGHSRGGEGVDRAATETPSDAPYRIAGQVLLAPVDVAAHAAPHVPTVVALPSCDGDVSDLQGQRYVDTARDVLADDTALRSAVMVVGANHNWFNTEWTPGTAVAAARDDWQGAPDEVCGRTHPDRLSPADQREVALGLVTAATRLFTGVDDGGLPLLDGSGAALPSVPGADLRSHAIGGGRDVRRPGADAVPTAGAVLCRGSLLDGAGGRACGRDVGYAVTPHWRTDLDLWPTRTFLEARWDAVSAPTVVGGLRLDRPLDLSTDRLELRTLLDPDRGAVSLRVRVTDGAGRSADLDPLTGVRVTPVPAPPGTGKVWAQAVVVDASSRPAGPGTDVDLTDVREVGLVAVRGDGRVWVADVSAAPAGLAAVEPGAVPRLDLGQLPARREGAPPRGTDDDTRTVRVPWTLTAPSQTPLRFAVGTVGVGVGATDRGRSSVVVVPPGQTSGTVPVTYTRDRRDDYHVEVAVSAYPLRGLATGRSVVTARVLDDDPLPRFRIHAPRRTITEGEDAVFRITVTGGRDYGLYAVPVVQKVADGRGLRVGDLPAAWVRENVFDTDPTQPLWKAGMHISRELGPRQRVLDFRVPTRVDREREGVETLAVDVLIRHLRVRLVVRVRDAEPR
ncbi:hypothetical protein GCM10023340_10080 [Nocardioides marinquilinus]|uniref:Secreted protein n=1 Tax=Nocardioides marinquilinus TaxID=1210400 RepID=A0ABP9PD07_9ACTN